MRAVATVVMITVRIFLSGLAATGQSPEPSVSASAAAPAEVRFQFDRIGLPVPHFSLRLQENGKGSYQAEQAEIPATQTSMRGQAAQHIDRTLDLTAATATKIFKAAHTLNRFNVECASKAKNIADTGAKTLTYTGTDGTGSCVYHYSENKTVVMLTDTLLGIANTLDEGRRLEFLHRYDRLGLDAEISSLAQQAEEGRALELGTISPTLAAIADDTAVIQRVRLRASKMLEQIEVDRH